MTQWITVDGERRWEIVPITRLSTFQLAKACSEVGMSPDALERAISTEGPDSLLAFTVVMYAARVAAGDPGLRTVEQANDLPYGSWNIEDDEPDDVPEDPTDAPSVDGGPSPE